MFGMNVVHTQGAQMLTTSQSHKEIGKTPFIVSISRE